MKEEWELLSNVLKFESCRTVSRQKSSTRAATLYSNARGQSVWSRRGHALDMFSFFGTTLRLKLGRPVFLPTEPTANTTGTTPQRSGGDKEALRSQARPQVPCHRRWALGEDTMGGGGMAGEGSGSGPASNAVCIHARLPYMLLDCHCSILF